MLNIVFLAAEVREESDTESRVSESDSELENYNDY